MLVKLNALGRFALLGLVLSLPFKGYAGYGGVTSIIPQGLCSQLSQPTADEISRFSEVAGSYSVEKIRIIDFKTAEMLFRQAILLNWSTLEFFTQDGMRGDDCLFYIPRETLVNVDRVFNLELLFAITGNDVDGNPFKMNAFFAGMGKHYIYFNRDQIVYKENGDARMYRFNRLIRESVVGFGEIGDIQGLEARIGMEDGVVGDWIYVRSSRKISSTEMTNDAGMFTVINPLDPIKLRCQCSSPTSCPHH